MHKLLVLVLLLVAAAIVSAASLSPCSTDKFERCNTNQQIAAVATTAAATLSADEEQVLASAPTAKPSVATAAATITLSPAATSIVNLILIRAATGSASTAEQDSMKHRLVKNDLAVPDPPVIELKPGALKIGKKCFTGCNWYSYRNSSSPICKNCATVISYDAINNGTDCYNMPGDIQRQIVSLAAVNTAKNMCAASNCKCDSAAITAESASDVSFKRAQLITIVDTMLSWFQSTINTYFNAVFAKVKKTKVPTLLCRIRKTKIMENQQQMKLALQSELANSMVIMRDNVANVFNEKQFNAELAQINAIAKKFNLKLKLHLAAFTNKMARLCMWPKLFKGLLTFRVRGAVKIFGKLAKRLRARLQKATKKIRSFFRRF